MDEKAFLADMEELLECDTGSLRLDQALVDTGKWDSLNFVSFLAMARSKYDRRVAPSDLTTCKTVGDTMKLVQPK